jgi:hypothetical protein
MVSMARFLKIIDIRGRAKNSGKVPFPPGINQTCSLSKEVTVKKLSDFRERHQAVEGA